MLLIDKLSYRSKLRYVNASEKLLYAVATLALCVISRSVRTAVRRTEEMDGEAGRGRCF